MGKRIIAQRRGKGSLTYRTPNYAFKPKVEYRNAEGTVVDIVNHKLRDAPLAEVEYADRTRGFVIAPQGIMVGDPVHNFVSRVSLVPEGTKVFAIETYPNSGPKLCRTAGSAATVVSRTEKEVIIQLPSKKRKSIHPTCRVTLGIPAGEGRGDKPWVKAGKRFHAMHARGKLYPRTSGVAMNAYDHPFGSGYGGLGKHKTVSRHAPPGAKVGSIAAKRTGRKKR
jgi:large subunit ribosomal protein L2